MAARAALGVASRRRLWAHARRHATTSASAAAAALQGNIGQPTHATHPHLLAAGEVTCGISGAEYAARRAALAARMPPDSVAVLAAAPVLQYHNTFIPVPSAYRQARRGLVLKLSWRDG